jgi:aerobic carbon-monoxide dehydrogenase large subunit
MGIACYVEDTGAGPHEQARVEITREGRVVITTGAASQGQGHATILAQIAAQQLGVDPTTVEVRAGDTANDGTGIGTIASRTAVTAGSSTFLAATEAAEKLKSLAAARLEASEVDLVLAGGTVAVIGQPDSAISFADLAADDPIVCTEAFPTPRPPYAFGSHVAEVEVDVETGRVTVIEYSVAHDCGTLLNPMIVDGQIDGGVVHGLSNALYERIAYSPEGQPLTTSFMDFRIPTAVEIPRIRKVHTVTTAPDNPLGAKGAGEGGTIPAAAAVAAAVEDALSDLGVVVDRYPLLPSVVRDLMETARRGN